MVIEQDTDLNKSFDAISYRFPKWDDYTNEERYEAVGQVYRWQFSSKYSFTDFLLSLFQKADPINLTKLRFGFNCLYLAYNKWLNSGGVNGSDFFIEYGYLTQNLRPNDV